MTTENGKIPFESKNPNARAIQERINRRLQAEGGANTPNSEPTEAPKEANREHQGELKTVPTVNLLAPSAHGSVPPKQAEEPKAPEAPKAPEVPEVPEVKSKALYDKSSPVLKTALEEVMASNNLNVGTAPQPNALVPTSQPNEELEKLRRENEELISRISKIEQSKSSSEVDKALHYLSNTDDLDEDFKDTLVKIFKPIAEGQKTLQAKLSEIEKATAPPTEAELKQRRVSETVSKIKEQIPEIDILLKSKIFTQHLSEKDESLPSLTKGEVLQIALERGDSSFVVNKIAGFLNGGAQPNIATVADVGATNGVGTQPSNEVLNKSNSKAKEVDPDKLRVDFLSGKITRAEFKKQSAEYFSNY